MPDVLFRLTGVMLRCHAIIRQLRLHPFAPPFLEPVDPAEWAGYLDKVTTPMVSVLLCTVTFHTNLAHSLTRSP